MEQFFDDGALVDSRYYNGSLRSVVAHYFPVETSGNNGHDSNYDDDDDDDRYLVTSTSIFGKRVSNETTDFKGGDGRINFEQTANDAEQQLMYYSPCGFRKAILGECPSFNCFADTDPRAVVSLALINSNSRHLSYYANKLPLMCINVRRFKYTVKALQYAEKNIDICELYKQYTDDSDSSPPNIVTLGMNYIIENDLKRLNLRDPPNLRFSKLLHFLKLSGSIDYVFSLASLLKFNVDLVYIDAKSKPVFTRVRRENIYRYKLDDKLRGAAIGTLTVVYVRTKNDETEWFVYVHPEPLLTFI